MKQITMLVEITFDLPANKHHEDGSKEVVDLINTTLSESELNCQPQITSERIVITSII